MLRPFGKYVIYNTTYSVIYNAPHKMDYYSYILLLRLFEERHAFRDPFGSGFVFEKV